MMNDKELHGSAAPTEAAPVICMLPPLGWHCTRAPGHEGPCAAAPVSGELPALRSTQMFDLAAPYFAWNAPSWHKATQGTIGMPNLLEYTRAAILADRAAVSASQAAPVVGVPFDSLDEWTNSLSASERSALAKLSRWELAAKVWEVARAAVAAAKVPTDEQIAEAALNAECEAERDPELSTMAKDWPARFAAPVEQATKVPTVSNDLIAEAAKLTPILRNMCEGGDVHGDGVDIYADDYMAGDGDTYVVRAAVLLESLAAPVEQGQGAAPVAVLREALDAAGVKGEPRHDILSAFCQVWAATLIGSVGAGVVPEGCDRCEGGYIYNTEHTRNVPCHWCTPTAATAHPVAADDQVRILTDAARDVLAERRRQVEAEHRTLDDDDAMTSGQMATVAGYYALASGHPHERDLGRGTVPSYWPWTDEWWKPRDKRRNLVRAGALILAEVERLDRATESASRTTAQNN